VWAFSGSVNWTDIDRGGIHTAPLTDDANTLEFLDSVDVDESYHGIDRASKLEVVVKLNDEIRVAIVDLVGPSG
jgi:hypothetical protein